MTSPDEDIDRRRPVWEALSDLFLDVELEPADRTRIATILTQSGYTTRELEDILWNELCPVLWSNLACAAGEWIEFNMAYVERQILSRPAGLFRRWHSYLSGGCIAKSQWKQIRMLISN